ncbi:unnamed protein product [Trichobilharzia regenti]|nr:unnamed protein product [Trichobilharzia regenti]
MHIMKLDSLDKFSEKCSPTKSQNPLVKSLLKPKVPTQLPSKDITYSKNQVLTNKMPLPVVVTRESSGVSILKSENTLANCTNDVPNKAMRVSSSMHELTSLNDITVKSLNEAQISTTNVTYTMAEPRIIQPVVSQINRIPLTSIPTGKVFNASNYTLHSTNTSAHAPQQLVLQMHRTPDVILVSNISPLLYICFTEFLFSHIFLIRISD